LRDFFEVWYDKFQLTLGDDLLQKITEGLLTSDFGVVVLSKAFFAKKKWAENELGGLFALETATRKIILPVWKDVTAADVRAYSPFWQTSWQFRPQPACRRLSMKLELPSAYPSGKTKLAQTPLPAK